jgi:hypothetical protein
LPTVSTDDLVAALPRCGLGDSTALTLRAREPFFALFVPFRGYSLLFFAIFALFCGYPVFSLRLCVFA